jgi:hypothetical protein
MHRFTKGLKRSCSFNDSEHREFTCFYYSFLDNSTDLDSSKAIFGNMCMVYLNKFEIESVTKARQALQNNTLYCDTLYVKEMVASALKATV